MSKFFKYLGKLLIIVTLALLAFDKFQHPNLFVKDYTHILAQLNTVVSKIGQQLPPVISN